MAQVAKNRLVVGEEDLAQILGRKRLEDTGVCPRPSGQKGVGRAVKEQDQTGGFDLVHGHRLSEPSNYGHSSHGTDLHVDNHHCRRVGLGSFDNYPGISVMDLPIGRR